MSATASYFVECAEAGVCPLGRESFDYLDRLEDERPDIDWIAYRDEVVTFAGKQHLADGIDAIAAIRLVDVGLANEEIADFVEGFGCFVEGSHECQDCGNATVWPANSHGERFCQDCL